LHLPQFFSFEWQGFFSFLSKGHLGVDVFFLLSGFILSHVYYDEFNSGNKKGFAKFIGFRFARLYPVHLFLSLFLLVYLNLSSIAGYKENPVSIDEYIELLKQLFMVHAWGISDRTSWNVPSWSISAEFFAYLLFPFLIRIVKFGGVPWKFSYLFISYIGLSVFCFRNDGLGATVDYGLVRIFFEFNMGCALYALIKDNVFSKKICNWFLYMSIIALVIFFSFNIPTKYEFIFEFIIAFFIIGLFKGIGPIQNVLGNKTMFHLGEISYSIYMSHWLVYMLYINIVDFLPIIFRDPTIASSVFIVSVMIYSHLLYKFIELPGRKYIRNALNAKP